MSRERQYKPDPRPKVEPARNVVRGVVGDKPESVDLDEAIGSESHKKQGLRYFAGKSTAGKNAQFYPSDINGEQMHSDAGDPAKVGDARNPGGPGNDLGEVVDQSGRKKPYGGAKMGWAAKSGKLGDLDPQETDQPSWVGSWSKLNTGPYGAGVTIDENYGVQRPRTYTRQKERFEECNPEFQDVADEGDWTSWKWSEDV